MPEFLDLEGEIENCFVLGINIGLVDLEVVAIRDQLFE
jgi:hypothetical protein